MKDSQRQAVYPSYGRDGANLIPGQRMVIQIIPLDFIQAEEMTKLLTPFVSVEGTIISDPNSNTLVVVDRERNIDKLVRLVDGFDVDLFDRFAGVLRRNRGQTGEQRGLGFLAAKSAAHAPALDHHIVRLQAQ